MFRKPFTVKSNANLKNSDRRKLLAYVNNVEGAISSKVAAALLKIKRIDGDVISVYTFDKEPMLFELTERGTLFPTVYFTWKVPNVFPILLINENVLAFLLKGADLMLPGVVRNQGQFPEFDRYAPIAISVISQLEIIGPVAVGQSLMSSMEMLANGMQGRGVTILHTLNDYLWEFGSRLPPASLSNISVSENAILPMEEDFPMLGSLKIASEEKSVATLLDDIIDIEHEDKVCESEEIVEERSESTVIQEMENLLERCFLAALKYRVTKNTPLPLDVGQFYSQYLLACVPSNCRIDLKKTSFKKFSNFLMNINSNVDRPIIKIVAKQKGSDVISEINWEHHTLKDFKVTDEKIKDESVCAKNLVKVDERYAVTEPVLPLFSSVGCTKGQLLQLTQIREIVINYVKSRALCDKNKVNMNDEHLITLVKSNESLDWNTLFQKIQSKMTRTYIITTFNGRKIIRKVELSRITFKLENRMGNKKVTLVNNLAAFGIHCPSFCQQIQIGVAASANLINNAPLCDGPQVQVQGNQVLFMSELLTTEYGIDRKYLSGLELIPKKKK